MAGIPISISARHVHLSVAHVEALFGRRQLTPLRPLSQPGQYACTEVVTLVGPKGRIERVRVLGPERPETQVEVSRTDERALGIEAPIRASGNTAGSPGIRIEGPCGSVTIDHGVIQAQRHIHMSPADAQAFGVTDREWVLVRVGGPRGVIFDDVLVRVHPEYALDMHLDADEANAADVQEGTLGTLVRAGERVAPDPVG